MSGDQSYRCGKGAVPVAKEETDIVGAIIRHYQIRFPVAVHIPDRDIHRPGTGGIVDQRLEAAVPIAQQDAEIAGANKRDGKVSLAVVVEIAGDNMIRLRAHGIIAQDLERAVPITQEHRDEILAP